MKFVIQHHICKDAHYDLMIESGDVLSTWRLSLSDINSLLKGNIIKVKKIRDHRKEYLTCEGPLSQGRGRVEIYDSGECEPVSEKQDETGICSYRMAGKIIKKIIRFQAADDF